MLRNLCIILVMMLYTTFASTKKGPYLVWNGDNTTMTILWQFDDTQIGSIEWGTSTSYTFHTTTTEYGNDHQHRYTITRLVPGLKYYYNVPNVGNGSFITAPPDDVRNVKIFVYGDTRSSPDKQNKVCGGMINEYRNDPQKQTIALLTGDFVSNGTHEDDWEKQFFPRNQANLLRFQSEIPICGPRGNHERNGEKFNKYFPQPWVDNFYYSFDYGPVHIVVIDNYVNLNPGSPQYNWLESDLATTNKNWKIFTFHEPGWGAGPHGNNSSVQDYLQPLCLKYGIDIVVTGHNHNYAHALVDGVHHLTCGGGGAPLYAVDLDAANIVAGLKSLHFCEIDINGATLTFTVKRPSGSIIDSFQVIHTSLIPSVTLTTPSDGIKTNIGTLTKISSVIKDAGGNCTKVTYKENGTIIGDATREPWEISWKPTIAGVSTLTATATIDMGNIYEYPVSTPLTITVLEPFDNPPVSLPPEDLTLMDFDQDNYVSVALNGSRSYDDGTIVSWIWKEGNTIIDTGMSIIHDFIVGIHTVTLEVKDNSGQIGVDDISISIEAYCNQEPIANAGNNQTVIDYDDDFFEKVILDGSSSYDPEPYDGTIVLYEWDINDDCTYEFSGNRLDAEIITYDFPVGDHIVTLRVTDNDGASHTDRKLISVLKKPTLPTVTAQVNASVDSTEEHLRKRSVIQPSSYSEITSNELFRRDKVIVGYPANNPMLETTSGTQAFNLNSNIVGRSVSKGMTSRISTSYRADKFTPNSPPVCCIINPVYGNEYTEPANVVVTSKAYDTDGRITGVELFVNNYRFGNINRAPHRFNLTSLPKGTYTLEVRARDDDKAITKSSIVTIDVLPDLKPVTIEDRVSSDNDVQESGSGAVDLFNPYLTVASEDDSNCQLIGLRFDQISIPSGVTITNAFIQFTSANKAGGNAHVIITGEATADATPFLAKSNNISKRSRTSSVNWNIDEWKRIGAASYKERTPDLKTIIQEIVDQDNYVSGNAIAFLFKGTGSRYAFSADKSTTHAALLHIEFLQ